jgi:hypothetical protein
VPDRGEVSLSPEALVAPLSDWILEIKESSLLSIVDCPPLIAS